MSICIENNANVKQNTHAHTAAHLREQGVHDVLDDRFAGPASTVPGAET
jgi:hypothetical protein